MHGALVCLHTSSLPVYQTGAAFTESVKGVNVQLFFLCLSLFLYGMVRAGQRGPAEEERVIGPLLSEGFLCALPHFHSKRAVFTKASHF